MKYSPTVLAFFLLLFACSQPGEKAGFETPSNEEINSVVRALIEQDSLHFKKRRNDFHDCPISLDLYKADIIYGKNWHRLMQPLSPGFDPQKDSAYLQFQDSGLNSFEFDNTGIGNYFFMDRNQIELHKNDTVFSYIRISIPQFSADGKTVYLQHEFICTGLCGSGYEYYLRKENGHWKIIKSRMTWVS